MIREHDSKSSIGMLLRCEFQYAERYAKDIRKPPSAFMSMGSAFGDGVGANLVQKIETHDDLPVKEIVEVAAHSLEERKDETDWGSDSPDKMKDELPALVTAWQNGNGEPGSVAGKDLQPASVEQEITVNFRDARPFLMYRDIVTEDGAVHEIKTSGRAWHAGRAETSLDAPLYTMHEPGDSTFTYHVAVRKKKPEKQTLPVKVAERAKIAVQMMIARARLRAMEIEDDPDKALPTGYGGNLCSKRYCGYWVECQAKNGLAIKD